MNFAMGNALVDELSAVAARLHRLPQSQRSRALGVASIRLTTITRGTESARECGVNKEGSAFVPSRSAREHMAHSVSKKLAR
eukprot:2779553-Pyramimonas_sp.AAC.1